MEDGEARHEALEKIMAFLRPEDELDVYGMPPVNEKVT